MHCLYAESENTDFDLVILVTNIMSSSVFEVNSMVYFG